MYDVTLRELRESHRHTIGTPYRAGAAPEVIVALCDVAIAADDPDVLAESQELAAALSDLRALIRAPDERRP